MRLAVGVPLIAAMMQATCSNTDLSRPGPNPFDCPAGQELVNASALATDPSALVCCGVRRPASFRMIKVHKSGLSRLCASLFIASDAVMQWRPLYAAAPAVSHM
jgi:hypothetical protein